MATKYSTPGVYIAEENAFPTAVVEVATAVPAFVGYTETAQRDHASLGGVPTRISSLAEFQALFGGPQHVPFRVKAVDSATIPAPTPAFTLGTNAYAVFPALPQEQRFLLYPSLQLFFANGGGACYIVSVGTYTEGPISADALSAGIDQLEKEQEPTLLVIPDAMHLPTAEACAAVQQHALQHCGDLMRNRFALLDVYNGYLGRTAPTGDPILCFRNKVGSTHLDFGAAYYPWLDTSVVALTAADLRNVDPSDLAPLMAAEAPPIAPDPSASQDAAGIASSDPTPRDSVQAALLSEMQRQLNCLPPSPAMAGTFCVVDASQGVWQAPANVSSISVVQPTVVVTDDDQQDLNVSPTGKSINAIRHFVGRGVLVWGARTLDGNSADWRYIHVRRTIIMIEESIRLAAKAYVFAPNTANTWVTVESMIANYLTGLWKRGGLAGTTPQDAFSVRCGLGNTMTSDDILEGFMRVTVLVAVTSPAEFIEISFQQQMQVS